MVMFFSILRVALIATVFPTSATAVPDKTAQTVQTGPPFLKINDYTVLYLSPVTPYRDVRGMLVAPVSHLAALLGVDAKTTADGKTVTLTGNGHTVVFTVSGFTPAGSNLHSFSAPIRWHGTGEIIAPVEQIALGLDIPYEWDPEHRVLQMHSGAALADQEDNLHGFPFSGFTPDPSLSPVSFRMTISSKLSGIYETGFKTSYTNRYRIVLRNGNARTILDDSVVDVIEEHPAGTRGDNIGKPGSTSNGAFGSSRREIKVGPGETYHLSDADNTFNSVETVLIATGSKMP